MNEEPTKDLSYSTSFEERVFARFDAVDARFDTVDARLETLESRSYDTKPIWERALAQIVELGLEVGEIKKKAGVIESKVGVLEVELAGVKTDIAGLKTDVTGLKTDITGMKVDVSDMRRELKWEVRKRLDQIQVFQLEYREDIRDVEERIGKVETKVGLEPDHD